MTNQHVVKIKEIEIDGKISYTATLSRGTYEVDGKLICVQSPHLEIECTNPESIFVVTETTIIDHYENDAGDKTISVTEFNNLAHEVRALWFPVKRSTLVKDGSVAIEVTKISTKSDCPYITSCYTIVDESDPTIFLYDRHRAVEDHIRKTFDKFGVMFSDTYSYDISDTKKKKIWRWNSWGNEDLTNIAAFGEYIFKGVFSGKLSQIRGSYSECLQKYNEDKALIRKIIKTKYNICFRFANLNKPQISMVLEKLRVVQGYLNEVEPKMKTQAKYHHANDEIMKLLDVLNEFAENFEEDRNINT